MARQIHELACVRCGTPFTAAYRSAKYCSNSCRQREYEDRRDAGQVGREDLIPPGLDTSWRRDGDCLDSHIDFFDPDQYPQAKAICSECRVSTECLGYALKTRAHFGMWGGTTPNERRRLPIRRAS